MLSRAVFMQFARHSLVVGVSFGAETYLDLRFYFCFGVTGLDENACASRISRRSRIRKF